MKPNTTRIALAALELAEELGPQSNPLRAGKGSMTVKLVDDRGNEYEINGDSAGVLKLLRLAESNGFRVRYDALKRKWCIEPAEVRHA